MNTMFKAAMKKICSVTLAAAMVCTVLAVAVPALNGEKTAGIIVNANTYSGFDYAYDDVRNGMVISGYRGNETDIVVPDSVDGYPVRYIEQYAFSSENSPGIAVQTIVLPDTVTEIGDHLFADLKSLKSVKLPEKIRSIPTATFSGCSSLEEIILPDDLSGGIGMSAFAGCSSLKSIIIPEEITVINSHLFFGCSSLTEIVLGDNITEIGFCAFEECTSLKSIKLPLSLKTIGGRAFYNCRNLELSGLHDGIEEVKDSAFSGCSKLGTTDGSGLSYRCFSDRQRFCDTCSKRF